MNALIALATLLSLQPAFAASNEPGDIYCHTPHIADAGYSLYISGDRATAVLSEDSFAGPRNRQDLICEEQITMAVEGFTQNTLLCRSSNLAGTTFVRLYENRAHNLIRASVRKLVNAKDAPEREVKYGALACQQNMN